MIEVDVSGHDRLHYSRFFEVCQESQITRPGKAGVFDTCSMQVCSIEEYRHFCVRRFLYFLELITFVNFTVKSIVISLCFSQYMFMVTDDQKKVRVFVFNKF